MTDYPAKYRALGAAAQVIRHLVERAQALDALEEWIKSTPAHEGAAILGANSDGPSVTGWSCELENDDGNLAIVSHQPTIAQAIEAALDKVGEKQRKDH